MAEVIFGNHSFVRRSPVHPFHIRLRSRSVVCRYEKAMQYSTTRVSAIPNLWQRAPSLRAASGTLPFESRSSETATSESTR